MKQKERGDSYREKHQKKFKLEDTHDNMVLSRKRKLELHIQGKYEEIGPHTFPRNLILRYSRK